MKYMHRWFRIASILPIVFLTACAMGPDYIRPKIDTAEKFRLDPAEGESIANLRWWELLQDETLQQLIRQALQENKDLKHAVASVEEFEARLGASRMDFLPNLGFDANAPFFGRMGGFRFPGFPTPFNYYGQATLNWELDIWGKIRRSNEAARAELLEREESRHAVILTLVSAVAQAYFDLLQLDRQYEIARQTLMSWQESLELSRAQLDAGVISRIEFDQIDAARADAVRQTADLERQLRQKENELSVLLGRHPAAVARGQALSEQAPPVAVPAGLPSELLQRRPDILRVEQTLAAATARIGVAKAARFPRLSITGFLGVASPALSNLLLSGSEFGASGLGLAGPLLNAQSLGFEQRAAEAQARQALAQYEQTVLTAFKEVEDALTAVHTANTQRGARQEQVAAMRSALHLADLRFQNGITSYIDVLLAKRALFDAESSLMTAQRLHWVAVVQLYKALGGGWVL
ncbi:MAG: efflux transporter outer membrane subunit [Nitrosomonas sp.]|nr:MAG: efflux transporter outer membrane subunit [Nitrosomonas sp.]